MYTFVLKASTKCLHPLSIMQAMIPFSDDELNYIARLDAEADMDLLRRELPSLREECLRTLQVATILLQRCAAAGACSLADNFPPL
jgi:hypothetical protein